MPEAVSIAILWQELCLQTTADSPSVRQILVERPDGTPYACGDHLEVMPKNSDTQAVRRTLEEGKRHQGKQNVEKITARLLGL